MPPMAVLPLWYPMEPKAAYNAGPAELPLVCPDCDAVLAAYHGLTTATAYDVLKAANYDATRAAGIVRQAKAAGQSVKDFIAAMVTK